jgi:endonuclease/exonuclease/phosphatase family metal-dependent hydrolase
MKQANCWLAAGLVLFFFLPNGRAKKTKRPAKEVPVTVMTYNLYLGANIHAGLKAKSIFTLPQLIDRIFAQVATTDFENRAVKLALTVKKLQPDVICLQEVALWRRGSGDIFDQDSLGTPFVAFDFLKLLQAQLKAHDLKYSIAASATNEDVRLPSLRWGNLRLTDRNITLVAKGIESHGGKSGSFATQRNLKILGFRVPFKRGWVSVDLVKDNRRFRVINTHLDLTRKIKIAQAIEILGISKKAKLPIVLAGDFNINPDENRSFARKITNQGLKDAWRSTTKRRGSTCCQPNSLSNRKSRLTTRVDLILTSKHFRTIAAQRIGADLASRAKTKGGKRLWISDHAGVLAKLRLPPAK